MERPRHRRSKSLTGEGNRDNQKQRITSSYNEEATKSVKKILSEEISKEMEVKKRSSPPSVIARLMGLDVMPPSPQHGHHRHYQRDENRSNRRNSTDYQEFRDVHEDLEASHVTNTRYTSKRSNTLNYLKLKEPEMVTQEFVSAYEKFNALKSRNDLLKKYFHEHVSDVQLSPLRNHIAILKPSNSKIWKEERECVCKEDVKSHSKRKDGLLLHTISQHNPVKSKSTKVELEGKSNKQNLNLPTRIVVLKPGKTSTGSFDIGEEDLSNFKGYNRPNNKEARDVARKITKQVRENFEGECGMMGYAGDESSYDVYDSDSDSVSDVYNVTSRKSFGWNNNNIRSNKGESSVNKEAKKRLSERWKMSHRYEEDEEDIRNKGSTLGEMLSVPDRDKKVKHLDTVRNWGRVISSSDGWKDERGKRSSSSSSRSRSLQKSNDQLDSTLVNCMSKKAVKVNSSQKKELRSSGKRALSFHDKFVVKNETKTEMKLEVSEEEQSFDSPKHKNSDSSVCDQETSIIQEESKVIVNECSESPKSYKEGDENPSPVSVLEVSFTEEISSSSAPECFQKVSTELQELRMQLQLLKKESQSGHEESMFVDEDHTSRIESWEDIYIIDLLVELGFEESDLYLTPPWKIPSLDFPLEASLFDSIEKLYSDVRLRSERKLLFDRLNLALEEIFKSGGMKWKSYGLKEAINEVVEVQERNAKGDAPGKMLDEVMEWSGSRVGIEMVCEEIEGLIMDELVMEAVTNIGVW